MIEKHTNYSIHWAIKSTKEKQAISQFESNTAKRSVIYWAFLCARERKKYFTYVMHHTLLTILWIEQKQSSFYKKGNQGSESESGNWWTAEQELNTAPSPQHPQDQLLTSSLWLPFPHILFFYLPKIWTHTLTLHEIIDS